MSCVATQAGVLARRVRHIGSRSWSDVTFPPPPPSPLRRGSALDRVRADASRSVGRPSGSDSPLHQGLPPPTSWHAISANPKGIESFSPGLDRREKGAGGPTLGKTSAEPTNPERVAASHSGGQHHGCNPFRVELSCNHKTRVLVPRNPGLKD